MIDTIVELIRLTATDLPGDVEQALVLSLTREEANSAAARILETILENVSLARSRSIPICQDTGMLTFYVTLPYELPAATVVNDIKRAVKQATERAYLRPNVVDVVTEMNTGDNVGENDFPMIEVTYHEDASIIIDLLLKGGGCENVGAQYILPHSDLGAERDLAGVRRCVLHSVFSAQGYGCAPGIIGVAVGGDRASGYRAAKHALLKKIGESHPNEVIANWERDLLTDLNMLGVGPMGCGGNSTVLAAHMTMLHRHPACYFVSIAYSCWACRRRRLILNGTDVQIL